MANPAGMALGGGSRDWPRLECSVPGICVGGHSGGSPSSPQPGSSGGRRSCTQHTWGESSACGLCQLARGHPGVGAGQGSGQSP